MELEKEGTKQKTRLGSRIWQFTEYFNSKFKTRFIFQHVFSHCGIVGNEDADKLGREVKRNNLQVKTARRMNSSQESRKSWRGQVTVITPNG